MSPTYLAQQRSILMLEEQFLVGDLMKKYFLGLKVTEIEHI